MYTATLIFPKDRTMLEKKYSEVLAKVVAQELTTDELGYLINELKKKEKRKAI